jgi:hypothetical protein
MLGVVGNTAHLCLDLLHQIVECLPQIINFIGLVGWLLASGFDCCVWHDIDRLNPEKSLNAIGDLALNQRSPSTHSKIASSATPLSIKTAIADHFSGVICGSMCRDKRTPSAGTSILM